MKYYSNVSIIPIHLILGLLLIKNGEVLAEI